MAILFVCRANVGRSQAAMALYNQIHPNESESAGTIVQEPEIPLKNREKAENIILAASEQGVDISQNNPRQITESLLDRFEKIIVMAEPETIPDWLRSNPKTIIWTIQDAKDQDLETTRRIVEQIKEKVTLL